MYTHVVNIHVSPNFRDNHKDNSLSLIQMIDPGHALRNQVLVHVTSLCSPEIDQSNTPFMPFTTYLSYFYIRQGWICNSLNISLLLDLFSPVLPPFCSPLFMVSLTGTPFPILPSFLISSFFAWTFSSLSTHFLLPFIQCSFDWAFSLLSTHFLIFPFH